MIYYFQNFLKRRKIRKLFKQIQNNMQNKEPIIRDYIVNLESYNIYKNDITDDMIQKIITGVIRSNNNDDFQNIIADLNAFFFNKNVFFCLVCMEFHSRQERSFIEECNRNLLYHFELFCSVKCRLKYLKRLAGLA